MTQLPGQAGNDGRGAFAARENSAKGRIADRFGSAGKKLKYGRAAGSVFGGPHTSAHFVRGLDGVARKIETSPIPIPVDLGR